MTKRRLGNEIDELSDEVLGNLDPERRLQLMLEAKAEGNNQWTEQLIESCPQHNYVATDHAFTDRMRIARRMIERAVYELHTTYLQYTYLQQQQRYTWLLDYERDEELADEELDRVDERADTLQVLFAELYTSYHAHRRFATEILDVDLETWIALHPEGPIVFEVVSERIENKGKIELVEFHLAELLDEGDEGSEETNPDRTTADEELVPIEDITDVRYEVLVSVWEENISE